MPEKKYDWDKMKLEYFLSPEMSIGKRLQENYGIDRSNHGYGEKKTAGWYTEKQKRIKEVAEKVQDEIQDEMIRHLGTAKKNLIKAIMQLSTETVKFVLEKNETTGKTKGFKELKEVDLREIERIRKMIKTELGEPTTVSKSEILLEDAGVIDEDELEDDY